MLKSQVKYNNEPLTNSSRLYYKKIWTLFRFIINSKNVKENKNKNIWFNMVRSGYEWKRPNPYNQMRNKYNKLKDI